MSAMFAMLQWSIPEFPVGTLLIKRAGVRDV
jgi:hypothetical protein